MKTRIVLLALAILVTALGVGIMRQRAPQDPKDSSPLNGQAGAVAKSGTDMTESTTVRRHPGRKRIGIPRIFGNGPSWSPMEAADLLGDGSAAIPERLRAAYALARSKDPAAFTLLWEAFGDSPMAVKVAILEASGQSSDPQASARIREFLGHGDEALVRAAIRALASCGQADSSAIIAGILEDPARPISVRTEAALQIATLDDPQVTEVLACNLAGSTDPELSSAIVSALGGRPLDESEPLLAGLLASKESPRDLRVAALESLGQSDNNPGRLVVRYVTDADPEIRLAAAWALGASSARNNYSRELTEALATEPEVQVRAALYSAMANQHPPPAEAMRFQILQESNDSSKAAGLWALSRVISKEDVPADLRSWFDSAGVQTLRTLASSDEGESVRRIARMALDLAGAQTSKPLSQNPESTH